MTKNNQGILLQLKRMDQKKQVLLDLVRTLPDERYRLQPDPQSWSPGQIANHLYLSERYSLAYLKKKLSYPDTIPPFRLKSCWSLFLVKFTLWTPVKVKAPNTINMWNDQEVLSPDELDHHWIPVRAELTNLILEHLPGFRTHLVYNHPFAGRMTFKQMLIFFNHHLSHHLRQIKRTIRKINHLKT